MVVARKRRSAVAQNRRTRRAFGVLIDLSPYGYQETVVTGSIDFRREHDVDVLYFITGPLATGYQHEHGKNIMFSLVDESKTSRSPPIANPCTKRGAWPPVC